MAETEPLVGGGHTEKMTTTFVTQSPIIAQQEVVFGPNPVRVMCPNGHEVTTNITYKCGGFACLVSCLLCWLNPHIMSPFCALIPLCVKDLKDVEHTCPVDGKVLGVFKRSSF